MNEKRKLYLELEAAIERRELKAYYQPQYDAITSNLAGAEALVRWPRPDGTMVMPGSFIPMLEMENIILELDWYILEEVCNFLKKQREENVKSVPIAVNFSRRHVYEEAFLRRLCFLVDRCEIPHDMIEIEITESTFVEKLDRISNMIQNIRNAGFQVAIDNFGSGLSSLSIVKELSVDVLKIDRTLISDNCESERERIVLESIFEFAQRLKLRTVAEGVETKEQLGFLRTCNCNLIQGYLYAKPMPEEEFMKVCKENIKVNEEQDILFTQVASGANQLLMEVIFKEFPLIIFINLTRNSYYMMTYEHFTAKSCSASGIFEESIQQGAMTMHPDDRDRFYHTFSIENQLAAHARGESTIRLTTRQKGDDGVYRRVETVNYFVKNMSSEDVLAISLNRNLE